MMAYTFSHKSARRVILIFIYIDNFKKMVTLMILIMTIFGIVTCNKIDV